MKRFFFRSFGYFIKREPFFLFVVVVVIVVKRTLFACRCECTLYTVHHYSLLEQCVIVSADTVSEHTQYFFCLFAIVKEQKTKSASRVKALLSARGVDFFPFAPVLIIIKTVFIWLDSVLFAPITIPETTYIPTVSQQTQTKTSPAKAEKQTTPSNATHRPSLSHTHTHTINNIKH